MPKTIKIIRDQRFLDHQTGLSHPEAPNRLTTLYRMLDWDFPSEFLEEAPRPATLEELESVHAPGHVQTVLATAHRRFTNLASDTTASAGTCLAAWLSAGGATGAMEDLLRGECGAAFVIARPPGHHALVDQAGGFCIFNNLGLAARKALSAHGLKRILIVDWDVHHGNALESLFLRDPEVFYFSTHDLDAYPHTGDWQDVGRGPGRGYNLNIPLQRDMYDEDVLHLYRETLTPLVERFRPQAILVAAGFDAHYDDPLGGTRWSEAAFAGLGELVRTLGPDRGVPLLLSLEGGYDPQALTASVKAVLESLMGLETGQRVWTAETEKAAKLLDQARRVHKGLGVWVD